MIMLVGIASDCYNRYVESKAKELVVKDMKARTFLALMEFIVRHIHGNTEMISVFYIDSVQLHINIIKYHYTIAYQFNYVRILNYCMYGYFTHSIDTVICTHLL